MKSELVAILNGDKSVGEQLNASDRMYLRRWANNCADDELWEEVIADARAYGLWPHDSLYSSFIWYAISARRYAESVKAGDDPLYRERQNQRAELFALAEKADDLARYFQQVERYSGISMFFQRFLNLPVMPGQEAVPRIEPPFLRVQQLQKIHRQEAQLLRQRATREPKPTTFISRKKAKRHITAFIYLMTDYMDEFCGKQHRRAVGLLASMAFNSLVDEEDVRKALAPSTKKGRKPKNSRIRPGKNVTNARGRLGTP
jgi:hypothetical protein